MFSRLARSLVLAASLLAVTATATFAHECFVVNRSATGAQNAGGHSQSWFYVDLPSLAGFLSDPAGPAALPALSPNQLTYFVARAEELGVPAELALFARRTIGEGTAAFEQNGKGIDGKGVDHFFDAHLGNAITAYMEALARPA